MFFQHLLYFSFFYIKHSKWLFFRSIFAMEFMPMFAYVTKYGTTFSTLPLVIIIINQKRQYVRIRTVFCKPPGISFLNFSSFHIFITLCSKCVLWTEYTIPKKSAFSGWYMTARLHQMHTFWRISTLQLGWKCIRVLVEVATFVFHTDIWPKLKSIEIII